MFKIARKLSAKKISTLFVELHSKDQSNMNYRWSTHDLYRSKEKRMDIYYVEPLLITKVNTRHYKCQEENNIDKRKCLDDYYISSLNCTFPWLEKTSKGPEKKCGSNHYVKTLIDLIKIVNRGK